MPDVEHQAVAEQVFSGLDAIKDLRTETAAELDVLMPSILDRASRGSCKGKAMKALASYRPMVLGIGLLLSASALHSYALTEGDYTYTVESGKATITAFPKNYAGALTMPAALGGCPVAAIGNNSFKSCTNLTAVTIPGTVTNVGEFAFWRCGKLASVSLPDSLTVLGLAAFCACPSLKSVTIPGGVGNVGKTAFAECGLTDLTIRPGVKNIDNGAFEHCPFLTSINIPSSVTNIADLAFSYCYGLTRVAIPSSIARLGQSAFEQCTNLSSVLFQGPAPTLSGSYVFSGTPATIYYLSGTTVWCDTFGGRPTLCWNPAVQHDANFGFTSDRFGFNIAGTTNIPVVVEAATDLASGVWTPLTNATLGISGSLYFTDPSSTNNPVRFYRIVWP